MMNVRIDPCNQSGETVMGRRLVMFFDPVEGQRRAERREPSGELTVNLRDYDATRLLFNLRLFGFS